MRGARLTTRARAFALPLLFVVGASLVPAGPARADVVGVLDPELAEICGGSAHAPNCRTEHVGMACCAGALLLVAGLGVAGVLLAGKREKQ